MKNTTESKIYTRWWLESFIRNVKDLTPYGYFLLEKEKECILLRDRTNVIGPCGVNNISFEEYTDGKRYLCFKDGEVFKFYDSKEEYRFITCNLD